MTAETHTEMSGTAICDGTDRAVKFMVAYARITIDKDGIQLQGVYFGGIGQSLEEADAIAKSCVNEVRGGTILPKIIKMDNNYQLLDALISASDKFERTTAQMQETEQILNRANRKR